MTIKIDLFLLIALLAVAALIGGYIGVEISLNVIESSVNEYVQSTES